jgi:hypothetical protein
VDKDQLSPSQTDGATDRVAEPSGTAADRRPTVLQRADPTVFALGSLGWKAFQDLCGSVLGTVLGQTVAAFRPTKDAGRDFAFEGTWNPEGHEALSGRFVIQCKFKAGGAFYRSDMTAELPKIRRLVRQGRCDTYVLMTNAGMTAATEAQISLDLGGRGVAHSLLIGGDLLDKYIREHSRLRALVPRLYGLGDLTQILDERRYQQAAALMESMREDIAKFVITKPYGRAVDAIIAYGFVLLIGAPAAGKSMIASALAAASLDMWGSRPMKIESAAALAEAWNPLEPDQFLWADDAFGATQYQHDRAEEWNQVLPLLRAAIGRGAKIVMTSRDYIWTEAADALKRSVFRGLDVSQVVVDVHDLSLDDKRQILYNHLRFGAQPREFRSGVKPFLEEVVHLEEFLPEVARRLGDPQFTAKLAPFKSDVLAFFENPVEHLVEVVQGLGRDEFAALALLFMSQGARESPVELVEHEASALDRLGSNLGGILHGLAVMRGSLVTLGATTDRPGTEAWAFKHPTIGDAVQRLIARRPELLQIYLLGTSSQALLREISCGDVGLPGALVVPPAYFANVANRLTEALRDPKQSMQVADFLVTRCAPSFLIDYGHSIGVANLPVANPATPRVAARLHALGLLPEATREALLSYHQQAAINELDVSVLTDPQLRGLMTGPELRDFVGLLHDEVVGSLAWYLDAERDNYDGSETPEDVVARLSERLEALAEIYPDDPAVAKEVAAVDGQLAHLEERLNEEWHGDPHEDDYDAWRDRQAVGGETDAGMFSDVDE